MKKIHPMTCLPPMLNVAYPLRSDKPLVGKFGFTRHDRSNNLKMHRGVDWACEPGQAIFAAHDAIVTRDGEQADGKGFGQRLYLKGQDDGQLVLTIYAHLCVELVATGQTIRAGHCIGLIGRSGNITVEPTHLHFEVRIGGEGRPDAINPEWWLNNVGDRMGIEGVN